MAKKNPAQQPFSEVNYIRQRVRALPLGKCYMIPEWKTTGETVAIVTRCHPKGTVTVGVYLVDTFCLGVKDSFYRFSVEDYELNRLLESYDMSGIEETDYDTVHNLIYGALEFAEEAGISPCKEYSLTQYILEEDTDAIPLMEFDYGKNGKHLLVVDNKSQLDFYLPKLKKNLGNDFSYVCGGVEEEMTDNDSHSDEEDQDLIGLDFAKSLEEYLNSIEYEEYTYKPRPDAYPEELNLVHKELYGLFSDQKYEDGFPDKVLRKILNIPANELREDIEQMLLFRTGHTLSEIEMGVDKYSAVALHSVIMLGEVGDKDSLAVILEVLRQSHDFLYYNFGDISSSIFIPTLYLLGQDNPSVFNDYLHEPGLFDFARSYVFSAVAMIADRQPLRRAEVIEWFRDLLGFYIDNLPRKRCCDGVLVALLVSDLIDINAVELLPELKRLFDTGLVQVQMCGNFEDVKRQISEKHKHTEIASWPLKLKDRYKELHRIYS